MLRIVAIIASASVALLGSACTTQRQTSPVRTATEQLLISTAADRTAAEIGLAIPQGSKVFLDANGFEGYDSKYAIGAIKDSLARQGALLVGDKKDADMIVEARSGALSTDERNTLIGIPAFDIPIPLAGSFKFPEIALFKRATQQGVAKFAATGYDAKTGKLVYSSGPQYGYSHETQWVVLLFFSWRTDDLTPKTESK